MPPKPTLVLGIGNVLMGDEGVGVHAISQLKEETWPPDVSLLDGGTGGFHLLSYFEEYDPILIIDATMDGRPLGTLSVIEPTYSTDLPKTLSAHDIGLRDLVESAALLGDVPRLYLLTVSIAEMQSMSIGLSPPIEGSLKRIREVVRSLLNLAAKSTSPLSVGLLAGSGSTDIAGGVASCLQPG